MRICLLFHWLLSFRFRTSGNSWLIELIIVENVDSTVFSFTNKEANYIVYLSSFIQFKLDVLSELYCFTLELLKIVKAPWELIWSWLAGTDHLINFI